MKNTITFIIIALFIQTANAQLTQKCENILSQATTFYKQKMKEGLSKGGYAYLEYRSGSRIIYGTTYNYSNISLGNRELAIRKGTNTPTMLVQKYDENAILESIDVLQFKNFRELVLFVEPSVRESCKGQFEVLGSGNAFKDE